MNTQRRIIVITEQGRIIGTQAAPETSNGSSAATAVLSAGPGQTRFEVVAEMPAAFADAREIEHFHARLIPLVTKAAR